MDFPCTDFKNKSVLFFYKGTTFPKIVDMPDLEKIMFQGADVMIARGLRMGVSTSFLYLVFITIFKCVTCVT